MHDDEADEPVESGFLVKVEVVVWFSFEEDPFDDDNVCCWEVVVDDDDEATFRYVIIGVVAPVMEFFAKISEYEGFYNIKKTTTIIGCLTLVSSFFVKKKKKNELTFGVCGRELQSAISFGVVDLPDICCCCCCAAP